MVTDGNLLLRRAVHNLHKWADALESGEYEEGIDSLRVENSFCVFGVLCDLFGSGEWVKPSAYVINEKEFAYYDGEREYRTGAPEYLLEMLFIDDVFAETLMAMNDDGKGFSFIASKIREYADELLEDGMSSERVAAMCEGAWKAEVGL